MLTRSLVMATGFVGGNGEYARGLRQFAELEKSNPEALTVLGSDHDLIGKNDQLTDRQQALVFSDRLLGRPEIRARIKSMPAGSTLAVVGSGESAAKGTIEALHLNPGLEVISTPRIRWSRKRFNEETVKVDLKQGEHPSFRLTLKDPEAAQSLREQRRSWISAGLFRPVGSRRLTRSKFHASLRTLR